MKVKRIRSQARQARVPKPTHTAWALLLCVVLLMVGAGTPSAAQSEDDLWSTPVNLSQSGAASDPVIVALPDGRLRVFWWDHFDGLTMAEGAPSPTEWSAPLPTPIFSPEASETPTVEGEAPARVPVKAMPYILGDAAGRAHALWLGEADPRTGARPLLYAYLAATSTTWTMGRVLAESVSGFDATADASGVLNVTYVRDLDSAAFPAGVYFRRSGDGGTSWQSAVMVYASRYLRLLSPTETHLSVASDGADGAYVAWDDPRLGNVQLAASLDGGATWQAPAPVVGSMEVAAGRPQRGTVVPVPGAEPLLIWEMLRPNGTCELYQASTQALLAGTGARGEPILPEWKTCLPDKQFLPLGTGRVLLAAERQADILLLAAWDGASWRRSQPLDVDLNTLQVALGSVPSAEGEEPAQVLSVVGTDDRDEVWITGSPVQALEALLAPVMPTPTPTPRMPGTGQEAATLSPQPTNLSRSGAASSPALVAGPGGRLRAFWWDAFDGLMVADGMVRSTSVLSGTQAVSSTLDVWSDAAPVPILLAQEDPAVEQVIHKPTDVMPRIVGDATGRSHALWNQQIVGQAGLGPLMYSTLESTSLFWSPARVLAESAVAFDVVTAGDGTVHLVYLRSQHTVDMAAGVYYLRSDDDGATWRAPVAMDTSRYYRLLTPELSHLRLEADGAGGVYVTWDRPHLERLLLASSFDHGATWSEPVTVGAPDGRAQRGRLFAASEGESQERAIWLLWEDAKQGSGCPLYQAPVREVLENPESPGERVLDSLVACPQAEQFLQIGSGESLMAIGVGSEGLTLAAWNGERWSEPRRESFRFEQPTSGDPIYLGSLQPALVQIDAVDREGDLGPGAALLADKAMVVVGTDQEGDVWASPSQTGALGVVFAPLPPWSTPVNVSTSSIPPDLPAMAADAEGRLHLLWAEPRMLGSTEKVLLYARWDGASWTRPAAVLALSEGSAAQPTWAVLRDSIHALWSDDQSGEIWHSRAFLQDAYASGGWSEPQPLPTPVSATDAGVASWPHVVAFGGVLHAVYAVPVNEGRGIYYVRSEDGGKSWQLSGQVFDAVEAGWSAADLPRLAVDAQGGLHVVWVRASLSPSKPPRGIYYATSEDAGQTWSDPLELVEGAYTWPRVAVSGAGQVHVLWNEASGGGAWHRWLADVSTAQGWTHAVQVPGLGDVLGPMGVAIDGAGVLHLAGLGYHTSGEPALLYTTWNSTAVGFMGGQWGTLETFRLGLEPSGPGISAALQSTLGRLDVVFCGRSLGGDETAPVDLWHTGRAIAPAAPSLPAVIPDRPAEKPLPTSTQEPSLTPTPEVPPTMTPDLSGSTPSTGSTGLPLPLLLGGGLSALIVVGVLGTHFLLTKRR